jgi:cobalt-zinc-cadmium efflux system membrane fusion protein
VEVKGGLHGGETLAADGSFLLKSDVLRSKMGAGCAD